MTENKRHLVGICGLYCGTCPYYLAFRNTDTDTINRLSQSQEMPAEEVRCDGCLSGRTSKHCTECRHGFRECADNHGVTWCFQCEMFPCRRLKDFEDVHVVNGISHHETIIKDLEHMKKHGVDDWIGIQEERSKCSGCGTVQYWYDRECPTCNRSD